MNPELFKTKGYMPNDSSPSVVGKRSSVIIITTAYKFQLSVLFSDSF